MLLTYLATLYHRVEVLTWESAPEPSVHAEDRGIRRVRLVYRTPDWEDFVQLAVTEIRQFGS